MWPQACRKSHASQKMVKMMISVQLPLRVIDIPATLATTGGILLHKPMDSNFHILSHTWGADIRNLSKKIGGLLSAQAMDVEISDSEAMAYNAAFQNANFAGSKAYENLRELLFLLREDGVERLWFDALCIDQTSEDEKSLEISRMADYYRCSQGCYVLVFGVGRGYRIWSDIKEVMPRWFQRVWTLQEFVLPKKLTFLVEALDARLVSMVKELSTTSWNSGLGFCKCGVPADLLEFDPPSIVESLHRDEAATAAPKEVVDAVNGLCPKCEKGMLVRGPVSCVNGKQIHFIDREAYLFIVRAGITIGEGSENRKHEEMLCGLFGMLEAAADYKVDPRLIILKIGERFCSHAEDRVLSILGLLGVNLDNDEQLRTGKTLDEQIIAAAQKCHPDTLVLLFATDGVGYPTMGMSWAPNFYDSWESLICGWNDFSHCRIDRDTKKQWIGGIQNFECKVELLVSTAGVREVSATGVKIACKKVKGYICKEELQIDGAGGAINGTGVATHVLFCRNNDERIMPLKASTWMFDSVPTDKSDGDHVKCRAVDKQFQIIYLVSTSDNHSRMSVTVASEMIPRDANNEPARALARIDVSMVLLGCIQEDGTDLIMVCLEEKGGELHKIGIAVLPRNQSDAIFGDKVTEECMIGGFGRDLSKYVKLEEGRDDDPVKYEDEESLYVVCKGHLCPPLGGPAVPHVSNICKEIHDRLPYPQF